MESYPLLSLCGFAVGGLGLTVTEISDDRMALLLVTAMAILLGAALAAAASRE